MANRGWQITERPRGEEHAEGAATWEIQRHHTGPTLLIDFAGLGPMGEDISLEESYACNLRGSAIALYFRRINRSRKLWAAELKEFISLLESVAGPGGPAGGGGNWL